MQPGNSARLRAAQRPIVALALVCGLASTLPAAFGPSSARAAAGPRSAGPLSPRLTELAKPAVRSAPRAKQAEALSLAPAGPGSLVREGDRVLVEVRFAHGIAAGADDLREAGAEVVDVSPRYQTVTVAAKPGELDRISAVRRVAAATEVLAPIASSTCPAGAVVSEGDGQLRAAEAREAFGVDGSGVTVGVLSDSFDRAGAAFTHAKDDVEAGDLPGAANTCSGQATPVDVLDDAASGGKDEGRAMAQIVHDLAPGAQLSFATAFTGMTAFAASIEALAAAGAKAIVDDVTYFEEPFFQEGPVGVAASNVTADGVSYFSSAANNNLIEAGSGNEIASWEAPQFRNSGGCPAGLPSFATSCMDFNPGAPVDSTLGLKVSSGATLRLDLQWAQPWNGVTTDLDAYLLNAAGESIAASENRNATSTERPFEFLSWKNSTGAARTVRVAINRCDLNCDPAGGDGGSPRLKLALLQNGGGVTESEYPESTGGDVVGPTIFGHNGGEDVTSVAAIRYDSTTDPEGYSSRGPVTHLFEPVTEAGEAAGPLAGPEVLSKPDVTATDCGVTTFFSFEVGGSWRFCGTSAAAPHAAAVAALMLEEEPGATPEEIRTAIQEGADPIGELGPCAVGAGVLDAVEAIERLHAAAGGPVPACTPPFSPPVKEGEEGGGGGGSGGQEGGGTGGGGESGESPPGEGGAVPQTTGPSAAAAPAPVSGVADRVPPGTFLRHRPRKLIRTRHQRAKAVFRFRSNERSVTFLCRVDRKRFRRCRPRFARRYRIGRHVVRVRARDRAGNVDRTPVIYRFRVKRLRNR
jgi:hypothetical protein